MTPDYLEMGGDGVEPPEPKHLIYSQARYPYGISTLRSSLVLTKLVNLSWSFRLQLPSALPLAESVRTQAIPACRTPLLVYTRAGLRHQRYTLHFVAGQV